MQFEKDIKRNKRKSFFFVLTMYILLSAVAFAIFYLSEGDMRFSLVGALSLSLIIISVLALKSNSIALAMSNAQKVDPSQGGYIYNVVEEMAIAENIKMPEVYIIDDPALNAFACGTADKGTITFTRGIIEVLNREELQGVAAHEMSHLKNGDSRLMTIVASVGLVIGVFVNMSNWLFWFGGRRDRDNDAAGALVLILSLVLLIFAPLLSALVQAAISRKREWLADESAVKYSRNPAGLRSALEKLAKSDTAPAKSPQSMAHIWMVEPAAVEKRNAQGKVVKAKKRNFFDTHPPIEERILALKKLEGTA